MFAWWGRVVVRGRWLVLVATLGIVAVGVIWGTGIFGALASGGFDDPASESSRAYARITDAFGPVGDDLVVLYTHPTATADQPALSAPVRAIAASLRGRSEVVAVATAYDGEHPGFVSLDGHSTYLTVHLRASTEDGKLVGIGPVAIAVDPEVAVLVNATSLGTIDSAARLPLDPASLSPTLIVADVAYNTARTWLTRQAAERGCRTIDGLSIYVQQTALAFQTWTGIMPDTVSLREAAEEFLGI